MKTPKPSKMKPVKVAKTPTGSNVSDTVKPAVAGPKKPIAKAQQPAPSPAPYPSLMALFSKGKPGRKPKNRP